MIDIGRVFATSWAMLRQRFWLLLGMAAVFFAILLVGSFALTIVMALLGAAGAVGIGAGLDDPASLTGMSILFLLVALLFNGVYLVIVMAQQAAMVTIASPLEEPSFGAAMARGFRSVPPFFVISVILTLGYVALGVAVLAVAGVAGISGGTVGGIIGIGLLLLSLPVMIYLGCRLAVLVPVVAVDQVWGPIAAIRRSWALTAGRVPGIFLAMLAFGVLSLIAFGLPIGLIFALAISGDSGSGAALVLLLFPLVFLPLAALYVMFTASYMAALHSEVTGGGAERLEEVFA